MELAESTPIAVQMAIGNFEKTGDHFSCEKLYLSFSASRDGGKLGMFFDVPRVVRGKSQLCKALCRLAQD